MTPTQFAALAKLLQSRHGPAEHAARLVLVNGIRNADAARAAKLTPALAFNAVTRYRRAYALALIVAGTPSVEITQPPVRGNTTDDETNVYAGDCKVPYSNIPTEREQAEWLHSIQVKSDP